MCYVIKPSKNHITCLIYGHLICSPVILYSRVPHSELPPGLPTLQFTMNSLSYGLNITKKSAPSKLVPTKRKPIFEDEDIDIEQSGHANDEVVEQIDTLQDVTDTSTRATRPAKKRQASPPSKIKKNPITIYGDLSSARASEQHSQEATSLDPSIYDYDAAFDSLHAKSLKKKAIEAENAALRKPKYMSNLLAAAEIRKRDQLRAQEKLLAKEREVEGDEYADKEKFVTEAYKTQQEEVRRLEEEERLREAEEESRRKGKGMTGFYRSMLDQDGKRHEETVAAAAAAAASQTKTSEAQPGDEGPRNDEQSESEVAKELKAKGRDITINDEGQVVDKRQLLSAGLNVAPKPKNPRAPSVAQAARQAQHPASLNRVGSKRDMRERQSRMLEEQLEQSSRKAAIEEAEKRVAMEQAAKSKKTEDDIQSARERYLQRRREAQQAKDNA